MFGASALVALRYYAQHADVALRARASSSKETGKGDRGRKGPHPWNTRVRCSAEASGFLVGPAVFNTVVGAQAPRRVRFPSASANVAQSYPAIGGTVPLIVGVAGLIYGVVAVICGFTPPCAGGPLNRSPTRNRNVSFGRTNR